MNTELILGGLMAVFLIAMTMWLKGFKDWLVWAVSEAEKMLGSGTGQLKLRYVYDLAVVRFPIMAKLMPFTIFSKLVDAALEVMKDMIANNKSIAEAITNQIEGDL